MLWHADSAYILLLLLILSLGFGLDLGNGFDWRKSKRTLAHTQVAELRKKSGLLILSDSQIIFHRRSLLCTFMPIP